MRRLADDNKDYHYESCDDEMMIMRKRNVSKQRASTEFDQPQAYVQPCCKASDDDDGRFINIQHHSGDDHDKKKQEIHFL